MTIGQLNNLPNNEAADVFEKCCGSSTWSQAMVDRRPFGSIDELIKSSSIVWSTTQEKDWLEAFRHHPKIGDLSSLSKKYSSSKSIARGEQSSVDIADDKILLELKNQNEKYEKIFGFIFIVYASGKFASQMLDILNSRINHTRDVEILISKNEQEKITNNRIKKLFSMISISTHILDTSSGKPANNVQTILSMHENNTWKEIAQGVTNNDGRVTEWKGNLQDLIAGIYKITFETKPYFDHRDISTFYPFVEIIFQITAQEHYHVPLLINPYGYTTYRGS